MSRQDERLTNVQEEITSTDAEGESSIGAKLTGEEKTLLRVATGPTCGSNEVAEPSSKRGGTPCCATNEEMFEPSSMGGNTLFCVTCEEEIEPRSKDEPSSMRLSCAA